jgi:recombinational DNA repair protein (RecF pathway)
VLAVVVDKHILADAEEGVGVHHEGGGHGHLEAAHVPRVARILQAVLVALQEELQLEPETKQQSDHVTHYPR